MLPYDDSQYDIAWKQFGDEMGFRQPFGMSTTEYRHDFFNEMSYGWNGRGWPFQNSVVYKAYAKYLRDYKATRSTISEKDRQLLYDHVTQYVELHGRRRSIGEWYLPRTGGYRMPGGGDVVQVCLPWVKGLGMFKTIFTQRFLMCSLKISLGFRVVTATVLRFTLCYQKQMEILLPWGHSVSRPRHRYSLERRLVFKDSRHAKQTLCVG